MISEKTNYQLLSELVSCQSKVEEILNHRFTDNKHKIKSNLQFLVKWKGLDKPSWEPWKNTSKLEKVHQYMKATKQLMMLLPKNLR